FRAEREQGFFARQLGGVGQGCIQVLGGERRITAQDLLPRVAFGKVIQDDGDPDARAFGAELTPADLGVTDQMIAPRGHCASASFYRTGTLPSRPLTRPELS